MFTKQHYQAIASLVATGTTPGQNTIPKFRFVQSLADFFAQDNDRFDRDKFFRACYPTAQGDDIEAAVGV